MKPFQDLENLTQRLALAEAKNDITTGKMNYIILRDRIAMYQEEKEVPQKYREVLVYYFRHFGDK